MSIVILQALLKLQIKPFPSTPWFQPLQIAPTFFWHTTTPNDGQSSKGCTRKA